MLKIKLGSHLGYQGEDLKRLKKTLMLLENTLNGKSFEEEVINFKSDKTEGGTFHFVKYIRKGRLRLRWKKVFLKKYSNREVYNKVIGGNEKGDSGGVIVFNLILKKSSNKNVVGYTEYGKIYTYRNQFKKMEKGKFAAHLFHEYAHTIGFKHSFSKKKDPLRNCYSVPYALGNIVEILTTGKSSRECNY